MELSQALDTRIQIVYSSLIPPFQSFLPDILLCVYFHLFSHTLECTCMCTCTHTHMKKGKKIEKDATKPVLQIARHLFPFSDLHPQYQCVQN